MLATSNKRTVVEVDEIVLTLNADEAETLLAITAKVGGDPRLSRRKHIDALATLLTRHLGHAYYAGAAYKCLNGTLHFANEEGI